MVVGRVKPQQNMRSVTALRSLSPKEGSNIFVFCWFTVGCAVSPSRSLSSSSSMTNWGAPVSSLTSSFFHNTSCSNVLDSPSISKTTGRIRWRMRRQFNTSFVAFFSCDTVADLMKDEAYAATDVFEGDGNVWSDIELKSRAETTWIRVATFSGASTRARRTEHGGN